MSIKIQECTTCSTRYFPERLLCRTCSGANFRTLEVDQARVEDRTQLADGTVLATLRIGDDVKVIARVHPETRKDQVLTLTDQGLTDIGQAYVPTRELLR